MNSMMSKFNKKVLIIPVAIIIVLGVLFSVFPELSLGALTIIRSVVIDKIGFYFILLGLIFFLGSLILAFSKYGKVKLGGSDSKKEYSDFTWGSMIFTTGLAADILTYALHEWAYYFESIPLSMSEMTLVQKQLWASSYPVFHWSAIPWGFYVLPAVGLAYMFWNRGRTKQTFSEACRPLIKDKADKGLGSLIDVLTVTGLLAGTTTTFSVATPMLSRAISEITGIVQSNLLTIIVLAVIAVIYSLAVLYNFKGISFVSKLCIIIYGVLLSLFFVLDPVYIIDSSISSVGNVINNFMSMSTWLDPLRSTSFAQDWTVYYWAYWISWSVAAPIFIAKVSKGRTIKEVILKCYFYGIVGTLLAFFILGNYGLHMEITQKIAVAEALSSGLITAPDAIVQIINTTPYSTVVYIVLIASMILFYVTSFDSITYVLSSYSYKTLSLDENPSKGIKIYWAVAIIILPMILLYLPSTTVANIQTVAIIGSIPLSIILILLVSSFLKSIKSDCGLNINM